MLPDGEGADKKVVLLHVGRDGHEVVGGDEAVIDEPVARDLEAGEVPVREDVEKSGLAGAAGAHDGKQLARLHQAVRVLHDQFDRLLLTRLVSPEKTFGRRRDDVEVAPGELNSFAIADKCSKVI